MSGGVFGISARMENGRESVVFLLEVILKRVSREVRVRV